MWRLCVTADGAVLRNPDEILHGWTLEQVEDAHAVLDMLEDLREKAAAPTPSKGK